MKHMVKLELLIGGLSVLVVFVLFFLGYLIMSVKKCASVMKRTAYAMELIAHHYYEQGSIPESPRGKTEEL